jgi:hypothetical protein
MTRQYTGRGHQTRKDARRLAQLQSSTCGHLSNTGLRNCLLFRRLARWFEMYQHLSLSRSSPLLRFGLVGVFRNDIGLLRIESKLSRSTDGDDWMARHDWVERHRSFYQGCNHKRGVDTRICRHNAPVHHVKAWLAERALVWIDSTAFATVADRDSTNEMSGSVAIDHFGGEGSHAAAEFLCHAINVVFDDWDVH